MTTTYKPTAVLVNDGQFGDVAVRPTHHCRERYQERRSLAGKQVDHVPKRLDLEKEMENAVVSPSPPCGLRDTQGADVWLLLGSTGAIPCRANGSMELAAITFLIRPLANGKKSRDGHPQETVHDLLLDPHTDRATCKQLLRHTEIDALAA